MFPIRPECMTQVLPTARRVRALHATPVPWLHVVTYVHNTIAYTLASRSVRIMTLIRKVTRIRRREYVVHMFIHSFIAFPSVELLEFRVRETIPYVEAPMK